MLPWRDPRILAKQLATIYEISGGRLIPAVAIGRFRDEFDMQQVPYEERGRITNEYLECLAAILGPTTVTVFEGRRVRIEGGEFFPKPKDLPIWICGMSSRALHRVARFGRGWLPGGLTPEEYAEAVGRLSAVLSRLGRSINEVDRGIEIFTCVTENDQTAHTIADASLRQQWGDVEDGMLRSLIGSPSRIRETVNSYIAAGVTHFELKFICHTEAMLREMIERYAAEIVPDCRSLAE